MVHMVTEVLLMTQLRTQLTKISILISIYSKKASPSTYCIMWKFTIDYSWFKTFMKTGKNLYPRHKSQHAHTLAMAWTPAISTSFKLYTDFHPVNCQASHYFSDPTPKNPLDQQSIRLTFSSILYTSGILLLQSTRSQSLDSIVLSCSSAQSNASSSNFITGYCHGELSKTRNHPNTRKSLSTMGKRQKPCSRVPRPSAFMETLCATPASCSLHQ